MSNLLLFLFLSLITVTGQFPTEFSNDEDSFDYNVNYTDDNTLYSEGYYLDADDFSIPSDKVSDENMDILSKVIVWDEQTGEQYPYSSAEYGDNYVTYTFEDMSLTVNYDIYDHKYFSIVDAAGYILQATYYQIIPILVSSIIAIIIVAFALFVIMKILNKLINKLLDVF